MVHTDLLASASVLASGWRPGEGICAEEIGGREAASPLEQAFPRLSSRALPAYIFCSSPECTFLVSGVSEGEQRSYETMITLKDRIRDCITQYEEDTKDGAASDPEALMDAILDEIKSHLQFD